MEIFARANLCVYKLVLLYNPFIMSCLQELCAIARISARQSADLLPLAGPKMIHSGLSGLLFMDTC
ncbi:hypothetical protein YA43_21800 [Enterobacter hormaechei subsp. steigerwaltii]|nr:hypothetical protein DN066_19485 [Enterobacter hormaechei subsp. xiangfangensis]AXO50228.1 hypothetical protein AXA52_10680 [Enterobacter hormaechei]KJM74104.1 hypothetical protein SS28_12195 [Enterobacter hormaechei subsp. steigerwaltii]KJN46622.1 hypothetical protein SS45_04365 [Enterobacter hormaechei subsp. steigerwaltii]KJP61363.1 hypothetical protein SR72_06780 [Enterobacter hormaechei subsp. steigerwaltii]